MIRSVQDVEIESRKVLMRMDLDCPVHEGKVRDNTRIRHVLPTLRHALNRRAKVVVMAHRGRPGGRHVPGLSMEPVGLEMATLLNTDVVLADDCTGDGARKVVADLYGGRIAMLENLRFHPGEEENDERFARQLAQMADVYLNDAFRQMPWPHASIVGVAAHVDQRCAGLLVASELAALGRLTHDVRRPFVVAIGGREVASRIRIMQALMDRVDAFLLGGVVASTFLAARGRDLGLSRVDDNSILHARAVMDDARKRSVRILLPEDLAVAERGHETGRQVVGPGEVGSSWSVLDIGPATVKRFEEEILGASTVLWTGCMGRHETPPFHEGTAALAGILAAHMGYRVVVGDETIRAIQQHCPHARFDHLCNGDEASVLFLQKQQLPGLKALES